MSETTAQRIRYKKPPIIERVVTCIADVSEESFYGKFDAWKDLVHAEFPEYDPIKEWSLNVGMKEGVPVFTESMPEVRITHRFWKKNAKGKRFMSMRLLPNQLTLNLHREEGNPHAFEDLFAEFQRWLPQWFGHFGATGASAVQLDYINLLSGATTPSFMDQYGALQIGSILKQFGSVPGRFQAIIPPYDCQLGLLIDAARRARFTMRVLAIMTAPNQGTAVRVDFQAAVDRDSPSLTVPQVFTEADFLHTVMVQQFEALFTDAAKKTFEPI